MGIRSILLATAINVNQELKIHSKQTSVVQLETIGREDHNKYGKLY